MSTVNDALNAKPVNDIDVKYKKYNYFLPPLGTGRFPMPTTREIVLMGNCH